MADVNIDGVYQEALNEMAEDMCFNTEAGQCILAELKAVPEQQQASIVQYIAQTDKVRTSFPVSHTCILPSHIIHLLNFILNNVWAEELKWVITQAQILQYTKLLKTHKPNISRLYIMLEVLFYIASKNLRNGTLNV